MEPDCSDLGICLDVCKSYKEKAMRLNSVREDMEQLQAALAQKEEELRVLTAEMESKRLEYTECKALPPLQRVLRKDPTIPLASLDPPRRDSPPPEARTPLRPKPEFFLDPRFFSPVSRRRRQTRRSRKSSKRSQKRK